MVNVDPANSPDPDRDPLSEEVSSFKFPQIHLNITAERNVDAPRHLVDFLAKMSSEGFNFARISPATRQYLTDLNMIEVESDERPLRSLPNTPFFTLDTELHERLWRCVERLDLIDIRDRFPEVASTSSFIERALAAELETSPGIETLRSDKHRALTTLGIRNSTAVLTPGGRQIRLSEAGNQLAALCSHLSAPDAELTIATILKIKSLHYANSSFSLAQWTENIKKLTDLTQPHRHLRKLYLAVVDGSVTNGPTSTRFLRDATIDQNIVSYLSGNESEQADAAAFLRSYNGGRYCPPPYRRSQEGYERTINDARRIVIRSRGEAGNFTQLAWESKRLPDKSDSLLLRFGRDAFGSVRGVHTTDQNIPPGGGFVFEEGDLNKLFFTQSKRAGIEVFKEKNSQWLAPAVDRFEDTTYVFLRGAKIAVNRDPYFHIDRTRYAYVVFNDHQNSSYIGAMLLPLKIIGECLMNSRFDLNEGPLASTASSSTSGFNARSLYESACRAGMPFWPIDLTGISCLFAGPAFGLPPESAPYFTWERALEYKNSGWHDSSGHVHCSYRVWDFREDKERVDETMKPLQDINQRVKEVAEAYQQLLGLFNNRYAAWKSDLTPGLMAAPRMLTECYRVHQFFAGKDEAPVLVRMSRTSDTESPIPVIDCKTMELYHDGKTYQLPRRSDGTENVELTLWNRYVRPYLVHQEIDNSAGSQRMRRSEGDYELRLMGREYLN